MKKFRFIPFISCILAGIAFGLWQQSVPAGVAIHAILMALYAIKSSD